MAVLVGDFLFAQSSWFLAKLDNLEVGTEFTQCYCNAMEAAMCNANDVYVRQVFFKVIRQAGWLKHCDLFGLFSGKCNAHLSAA